MKKLFLKYKQIIYSGVLLISLMNGKLYSQPNLDSLMDAAVDFARIQLEKTIAEIASDSTVFPSETLDPTHKWLAEDFKSWNSWWTSGYFPACYWYMYQLTQEEKWKDYAEKWTAELEPMKSVEDFSNIADIIYYSFGNGYKNINDAHYASVIDQAATTFIKLYDPDVEAIKCWGGTWSKTRFAVVTDVMIDNEFLLMSYQLTGNKDYYDVVNDHVNKTIDYNIREDGSVWQFVDFDVFGDPIGYNNTQAYQGAPTGTRWTRAHAWAINGLTQAYRYTRRQKYLDAAKKIADYYIEHLPEDLVHPSDFDLPLDAENGRDAAAAAISCSGLYELSQYAGDEKYRHFADSIMVSLCSPGYLAKGSDFSSILKRGQVRYTEPEKGLIYADAFFLEAILKYKGMYKYFLEGEGPINFGPVAKAGKDQTITDTDQDGVEIVTLDGSASIDPDDSIALYEWMIDNVLIGAGETLSDTLPVGIHQITLIVTDKYGKSGTDTLMVTILADHTGENLPDIQYGYVEIAPNPVSHGLLTLTFHGFDPGERFSIELYDLSGKPIYQSYFVAQQEESYMIEFNKQVPGIYILKVTGHDQVINRKVIFR